MKSIQSTVIEIVKELNRHKIDYFITGGTVLFLKGIIKETKDIDFFVNYKDLKKLKEIYKYYITVSEKKEKNYLNIKVSEIEIEFIGVNSIHDKKSYAYLKNKDYEIIKLQNQKINVSSLLSLIECYKFAYKKFKKEKHLKRIELIKNYIKKERI